MKHIISSIFLLTAASAIAHEPLSLREEFRVDNLQNVRLSRTVQCNYTISRSENGSVSTLGSVNGKFTTDPNDNGPLVVREIESDFLMTLTVKRRWGATDCEGGLIIVRTFADGTQETLRAGRAKEDSVFITKVTANSIEKISSPPVNSKKTTLQMESENGMLIIRAGKDKNTLKELQRMPLPQKPENGYLEIGIYQCSGEGKFSGVELEDFVLLY